MRSSKERTEAKVRFIVRLLPIADNKTITDLLCQSFNIEKIGKDYVCSIRRIWKEKGRPDDWTLVLDAMRGSHRKKAAEADVEEEQVQNMEQGLFPVSQEEDGEDTLSKYDIKILKLLIKIICIIVDATKPTSQE